MHKELLEKSDAELAVLAKQCKAEISALRVKKSMGQIEKTHTLKEAKKSLARVLFTQASRVRKEVA